MSHNPYFEKCIGIGLPCQPAIKVTYMGTKHTHTDNFNALLLWLVSAVNGCNGLCHEVTAFILEIADFGGSSL